MSRTWLTLIIVHVTIAKSNRLCSYSITISPNRRPRRARCGDASTRPGQMWNRHQLERGERENRQLTAEQHGSVNTRAVLLQPPIMRAQHRKRLPR
jgi:hypothetical protein